jgi:hypothetical protein
VMDACFVVLAATVTCAREGSLLLRVLDLPALPTGDPTLAMQAPLTLALEPPLEPLRPAGTLATSTGSPRVSTEAPAICTCRHMDTAWGRPKASPNPGFKF